MYKAGPEPASTTPTPPPEPELKVTLFGWVDHEDYYWKDKDSAINYFERYKKPFSLRPVYAIVSNAEEERFNGF